ncbi:MAG: hypothetical protein MUD10_04085 [Candidatus Pacebacteria bacterium]|jgi:hypothetical protein|nr:hypothetical protein [Candidatus Paceibacterota bacterium]
MIYRGLSQAQYEQFALFYNKCSAQELDSLFLLQSSASFIELKKFKKSLGKNAEGFIPYAKEAGAIKVEQGFVGLTRDFNAYLAAKEDLIHIMAEGKVLNEKGRAVVKLHDMC